MHCFAIPCVCVCIIGYALFLCVMVFRKEPKNMFVKKHKLVSACTGRGGPYSVCLRRTTRSRRKWLAAALTLSVGISGVCVFFIDIEPCDGALHLLLFEGHWNPASVPILCAFHSFAPFLHSLCNYFAPGRIISHTPPFARTYSHRRFSAVRSALSSPLVAAPF